MDKVNQNENVRNYQKNGYGKGEVRDEVGFSVRVNRLQHN